VPLAFQAKSPEPLRVQPLPFPSEIADMAIGLWDHLEMEAFARIQIERGYGTYKRWRECFSERSETVSEYLHSQELDSYLSQSNTDC
jgi:hypothetical protein